MSISILPELKRRLSPLLFDEKDIENEKIPALELDVALVGVDVLGVCVPRVAKQDPFGQNDSP